MTAIRSLDELTAKLRARTVKVAGAMPTDPTNQGTVSIPVDPSASASAQNMPASGTNTKSTAVLSPPGVATKPTIETPSLSDKAASVLAGLKNVVKSVAAPPAAVKSAEENSAPAADASQPPGDAGVPDKHKAPTPDVKADSKGELPADGTNKDDSAGKGEKVAGLEDFDPEFARTLMCKLSSMALETEEGRAFMGRLVERAAGAEAAQDIIKAAMWADQNLGEEAQLEAAGADAADNFLKQASPADQVKIIRLATALKSASACLSTPEDLKAFEEGVEASATLLTHPKIAAALGLDPAAAGGAPPPGGAGGTDPAAGPEAGAEGPENPEMPPVSDEDLDPEAIMQAIQEMVESGELDPDVAQQVVEALQKEEAGGAGGAGGEEGAPPPDGGGAEGAMAPPEEVKSAAALTLEILELA